MMKKLFYLMVILPTISFAQSKRVDDNQFSLVGNKKSISIFKGWMKNDIGKWVSGQNSIPNYDHTLNGVLKYCDKTTKYEISDLKFGDKNYKCLVKFSTAQHLNHSQIITEYLAEYWLIDKLLIDTSAYSSIDNLSVNSTDVATYSKVPIISLTPISWAKILSDIKKNYSGDDPNINLGEQEHLILKFRPANSDKIQFWISFNMETCSCTPDNPKLEAFYYEIDTSLFKLFFK